MAIGVTDQVNGAGDENRWAELEVVFMRDRNVIGRLRSGEAACCRADDWRSLRSVRLVVMSWLTPRWLDWKRDSIVADQIQTVWCSLVSAAEGSCNCITVEIETSHFRHCYILCIYNRCMYIFVYVCIYLYLIYILMCVCVYIYIYIYIYIIEK